MVCLCTVYLICAIQSTIQSMVQSTVHGPGFTLTLQHHHQHKLKVTFFGLHYCHIALRIFCSRHWIQKQILPKVAAHWSVSLGDVYTTTHVYCDDTAVDHTHYQSEARSWHVVCKYIVHVMLLRHPALWHRLTNDLTFMLYTILEVLK